MCVWRVRRGVCACKHTRVNKSSGNVRMWGGDKHELVLWGSHVCCGNTHVPPGNRERSDPTSWRRGTERARPALPPPASDPSRKAVSSDASLGGNPCLPDVPRGPLFLPVINYSRAGIPLFSTAMTAGAEGSGYLVCRCPREMCVPQRTGCPSREPLLGPAQAWQGPQCSW